MNPLLAVVLPPRPDVVTAEFLPVLIVVGPLFTLLIIEFSEAEIPAPLFPFTLTAPLLVILPLVDIPFAMESPIDIVI